MNATITTEKGQQYLNITLPLQEPRESASGKTLVVATTGGNKTCSAKVNGKEITIGVNAYIKK